MHSYDTGGFGERANSSAEMSDWSFETAAGELEKHLGNIGRGGAMVVGASMGGTAALVLASRAPEGLTGVIAIGASPRALSSPGWAFGVDAGTRDAIVGLLQADLISGAEQLFPQALFNDDDKEAAQRGLDVALASVRRLREPTAPMEVLRRTYEEDLRPILPSISVPVLLIHGERDQVAPPGLGEWMAVQMPRARFAVIAGAGHAPHVTYPEQVAALISDFNATAEGQSGA